MQQPLSDDMLEDEKALKELEEIKCPARNLKLTIAEISDEQFSPEGWCRGCGYYEWCLEAVRGYRANEAS